MEEGEMKWRREWGI